MSEHGASPPELSTSTREVARGAALVLVLVLAIAAGFFSRGIAAPVPADAPAQVFSADRAATAVEDIVDEPRPIGSPAIDAARTDLVGQLEQLGFTTRVDDSIGSTGARGEAVVGYVRNIVATRPGTDPTGTIVLATHVDTVPGAPGAGDAGVGLAVILESLRALGPEAQRNDLVVLLVDGEEDGLLGAAAFMRDEAPSLKGPVVVLNHEARGVSGRPMISRTAGPMHDLLPAMPSPESESFTDAVFEIIPNDTDFTVYRNGGWWGVDMAIIGDSWAYHSPQDDADHLDHGALQHYGDLSLSLTRTMLDADLQALQRDEAQDRPVMTTMPWGILSVPQDVVRGIGLLGVVLACALLAVDRRRGDLSFPGVVLGVAGSLVSMAGAVALAVYSWTTFAERFPAMLSATVGEPFRAGAFLASEVLLSIAVLGGAFVLLRRFLGPAAIAVGAALVPTILVAAIGVWMPSLVGWLSLPLAAAVLLTLISRFLPTWPGMALRAAALLAVGWTLGTQSSAFLDFGMASSNGIFAGTWVLMLLGAAPALLPRRDRTSMPYPGWRRSTALVLVTLLVGVGLAGLGVHRSLGTREPVQETVTAEVSAEDGSTIWITSGRTAWARELSGTRATSDLPAPDVEMSSTRGAEGDVFRMDVTSRREARTLLVTSPGGALHDVTVDGVAVAGDGLGDPMAASAEGTTQLRIVGVAPGQTVRIEGRTPHSASISVGDQTDDLNAAGGWTEPGDQISVVRPALIVMDRRADTS